MSALPSDRFSFSRFYGLTIKEILQITRDPSSFLIAVVLPLLMIFLFAYGISLDTNRIAIGLALEDKSPLARNLGAAFEHTPYFKVITGHSRQPFTEQLIGTHIHGIVVIPQDFSIQFQQGDPTYIQVIADGTETNTASFIQNYAQGVVTRWEQNYLLNEKSNQKTNLGIVPETRVWFNPELKSRYVILPGSIAVIMALIGTLLTSLVVAREWERGTMEGLLATPLTSLEFVLGKLTPYFIMGMGSMSLCVFIAVVAFQIPFVGSFSVLFISAAIFLLASLCLGFLISIISKNQFIASQAAINSAFLPAYMLSGFLYEIQSMPAPVRMLTYLLPPRYFVSIIQTVFLAGNIWALILPNLGCMLLIVGILLYFISKKMRKSLE